MGSVQSLSASKIQQMFGEQVVAGLVDVNGNLLLERRSGETVNAGSVRDANAMPTYREANTEFTKLPNDFLVGITYGQATDGYPNSLGVVETIYMNENRATQNLYVKNYEGDVWTRRAFANEWSKFRRLGVVCGTIEILGGSSVPLGAFVCNGDAISRTEYADLFGKIGTQFGAGDGSTTFNLPDLRGKVVAGISAAETEFSYRGKTGGVKAEALSADNVPQMPVQSSNGSTYTRMTDGQFALPGSGSYNLLINAVSSSAGRLWANIFSPNTPVSKLQPYMALNYIIWA